jgi:DNA-binding transcriptional MerR regulator
MEAVKRIGEVRKELLDEFNLDIQVERLRRYEELGLFESSREKTSNFRTYTDDEFEELKNTILLLEIGVKIKQDNKGIEHTYKGVSGGYRKDY